MSESRKYLTGGVLGLLLGMAFLGTAATVSYFGAGSADQLGVSLATLIAGEDQTNNVLRVEGQFSYQVDDADIVLADAGYLHTFTCWPEDASAEAGSVSIRDADTAGTGTILYTDTIAAAAYVPGDHNPKVPFDTVLTTGLVIDFTTTTDVFCFVSYR